MVNCSVSSRMYPWLDECSVESGAASRLVLGGTLLLVRHQLLQRQPRRRRIHALANQRPQEASSVSRLEHSDLSRLERSMTFSSEIH